MIENFKDKINTNGFDKRPDDAKLGGRKPSIEKQLINLLNSDGTMTIPKEDVVVRKRDGRVIIKVPTQMQLAMKLVDIAMTGNGADSLRSLKLITERLDGRPNQNLDINHTGISTEMPKINLVLKEHARENDTKTMVIE